MNWYLKVLKQYFDFNGRARRKEYWMFTLISFLVAVVIGILEGVLGLGAVAEGMSGPLGTAYSLAVFIPGLAVSVRRLHDVNKSGWWIFIVLIPIIGFIWLIILACRDSDAGKNQYGPNPKGINGTPEQPAQPAPDAPIEI